MVSKSISLVKITPPRYSDVYPRKRLFDFLDKSRRYPIVWITAPPGYGKTILVSSYIDSRNLSCLWYQIDMEDVDISTFFYYMGLAVRKASPRRKRRLPLLTPEYLPGLSTFTHSYFEDLFSRFKPPACVVLDNYQEVSSDSLFHEIIKHGVEAIPEGVNMIIMSRREPPPALARLRASHSMKLLDHEDLSLTPEETLGIMKLRVIGRESGKRAGWVSKETAVDIHQKTHGWAAGVILMIEKIRKGTSPEMIQDVAIGTVHEFFTSEIMEKLDEETRIFLMKSALLPDMDANMAAGLTGVCHAGDILAIMSSNNCFTERRFGPDPVYKYHPLFRDYLLSGASAYFREDELHQLKSRAAVILEEAGMTEDAFQLFREAGDYEGVVKLILANASGLVALGRGGVVGKWVGSIPEAIVKNSPWLLYWLGVSRMAINPQEAYSHLEQAFDIFRLQKDRTGLLLTWADIVSILTYASPYVNPLDQWLEILDELIEEYGEFPDDIIGARMASAIFTAYQFRRQDHPDIDLWEKKAISLSEKSQDINIMLQARVSQALGKVRKGDFSDTGILLDSLRRIKKSKDATPLIELTTLWAEVVHFVANASHEECLAALSEGQKIAATTGVHVLDFPLTGHGVVSALNAGDLIMARQFLGEMAPYVESVRPYDQCFYHFLKAYTEFLGGNISRAASEADVAVRMAEEVGFAMSESLCHTMKSHILHKQKRHGEAKKHLDKGRSIADRIKGKNMQYLCLLTEALFFFDRGEERKGWKALRMAMVLGREQGYVNNYIWLPEMMAKLCVRALEAGIEPDYVRWLIKKRGIVLKTPPVDVEEWPWAIKIYTLGRFSLVKQGNSLGFSRKAQQRPLDLLKALIAMGGRDVPEGDLSDLLWPECDGDAANQALSTNLHRLRQLLGDEKTVILRDGKVSLNPSFCWVDAWAFERLLGNAERSVRSGEKSQAITFIEKALALYQGPFLSTGRGEEWASSRRERLRSKYLRFTGVLAGLHEEAGDLHKAIETWQKGIEVDPAAEEFYQHLMTCYQRLGRLAEAVAAYDRLKRVLASMMGIAPSPDTEAIYQSLK